MRTKLDALLLGGADGGHIEAERRRSVGATARESNGEIAQRLFEGHLRTLSMPWYWQVAHFGARKVLVPHCPVCDFASGKHATSDGENSCAWLNSARACGIA